MPATNYIGDKPCTQCFQGQQLDALIVVLLAEKAGFTIPDDLTTLIEDSACLKCLSETQLKDSLAALLWQQQDDASTANEMMEKVKCLNCADPKTIKALTTHLLQENLG